MARTPVYYGRYEGRVGSANRLRALSQVKYARSLNKLASMCVLLIFDVRSVPSYFSIGKPYAKAK
jgi:hypothetical protein